MSSEELHAPRERLSKETIALHQATVSLMEELEASDWYCQRADDCDGDEGNEQRVFDGGRAPFSLGTTCGTTEGPAHRSANGTTHGATRGTESWKPILCQDQGCGHSGAPSFRGQVVGKSWASGERGWGGPSAS